MVKKFLSACIIFSGLMGAAQNGALMEYKISSSKGVKGSMKLSLSEFGAVSEFTLAIPQMPGGGSMENKMLSVKTNTDLVYMINDKARTYSEVKQSAADDNKNYTVSKMGDETLNGYQCTHAIVTDGKESYEVWNTKDISDYDRYAEAYSKTKRFGSGKRAMALRAANCDGIPVKTIHTGNEREGDMTIELVKFEKKNFAQSDFEIPAGYAKSELQSMPPAGGPQMKSQQELMNMSPEERAKYAEEMKKKYGK